MSQISLLACWKCSALSQQCGLYGGCIWFLWSQLNQIKKKKKRKEYKEKLYWTLDKTFTVTPVSKSVLENIYIYLDRGFLLCLFHLFSRIVCVVIYFSHLIRSHQSLLNNWFMVAWFAELLLHLLRYWFHCVTACFLIMCGGITKMQKCFSRFPVLHIVENVTWALSSLNSMEGAYARKYFRVKYINTSAPAVS